MRLIALELLAWVELVNRGTMTGKALPKCDDGVVALTRIRNRTVHPPKGSERAAYSNAMLEEAWRFAVQLLERAILAESGYQGAMHDRVG